MELPIKLGILEDFMNKEEILEKSRTENKLQDEMEKEVNAKAGFWGAKIGVFISALILFLNTVIANQSINYDGWAIYCSILGTMELIIGIKLQKKFNLICGIIILLSGVINFALYVKNLFAL